MIKILPAVILLWASTVFAEPSQSKTYAYINYAPDITTTSSDDDDSRFGFDVTKGLYGYDTNFGYIEPCQGKTTHDCIVFGFMAVYRIPNNARQGDSFRIGEFEFRIRRNFPMMLMGSEYNVMRVDVKKNGVWGNSYLYSRDKGVIAIILPNFTNKEIPESIFFSRESSGLFSD